MTMAHRSILFGGGAQPVPKIGVGSGAALAAKKCFCSKIPEKSTKQQWHLLRAEKLSAAVGRSTKVGSDAHRLSASAARLGRRMALFRRRFAYLQGNETQSD